MDHKNNCLACGKDLVYTTDARQAECYYCKERGTTNAACADGHYVCDPCHGLKAGDLIEHFCIANDISDPLESAMALMRSPEIKMHGPEHHFLVPAVLLAACPDVTGSGNGKADRIGKARQRAKNVLGGFCGFYGSCGAAVGTGIFVSVLTNATPLSKTEWRLSNLMTAQSLSSIARHGGPRCCKRNSFLALKEAVAFANENLGTSIKTTDNPKCTFFSLNKECLEAECPFY